MINFKEDKKYHKSVTEGRSRYYMPTKWHIITIVQLLCLGDLVYSDITQVEWSTIHYIAATSCALGLAIQANMSWKMYLLGTLIDHAPKEEREKQLQEMIDL